MTATPHAKGKSRTMWWISGAAVAIVVVLGIAVWATARSSEGTGNTRALVHTVSTGPLVISVSEAGTIKARQQEIIKNEVEGQTTLLYLIPEGTRVTKGELLAELDSSRLQDERIEKQISVKNAEAAYVQAKENLEVVKNQAESDISKAELDHRFALEDLQNYENGEYPKLLTEAEARIQLAEAEQSRSEDRFDASKKLFEQKFISSTELTADELSFKKAQNDVLLANGEKKLLVEFTHKRKLDELKSNIEQIKLALDRTKLKANADIVQAQANLDAKELEFKQQTDQLAKIDRQIIKCKLVAPTDGLVVYATTGQQGGGWRGNQEPLAEGQSVRERQDLIYLPTANLMMAEIKIHESSLDKVAPGLPVRIAVDALPGKQYFGRVERIAPLPDAQSQWMNPDLKVYNTQIFIDGEAEGLRTGMSCRAEVIVDQYQDVLSVPVQSVIRVAGKPTVYVMTADGRTEPRQVELGLDNNQLAHVKSGVQAGERVLMNPPLQDATMDMGEQFASADDNGAVAEALRSARANGGATTRPTGGTPNVEATAAGGPPAMGAPGAGGPQGEGRGNWGGGPGGGGGGGFDWANATEEQRAEMRRRRAERGEGGGGGGEGRGNWGGGQGGGQGGGGGWGANMTPEQREEMRRRFENMSPEEREQMRGRWRQGGGQGGEGGPGAGGPGGPPAGGQ